MSFTDPRGHQAAVEALTLFRAVLQGIPTLLMAAGSFDDILAITGFSTCLGMAFSTGGSPSCPALVSCTLVCSSCSACPAGSTWMNILKGLLEVVGGVVAGVILGVFLCYFPSNDQVCSSPVSSKSARETCPERRLLAGGPGAEEDPRAAGPVHIFGLLQPCCWLCWSRRSLHAGAGVPGCTGLEDGEGSGPGFLLFTVTTKLVNAAMSNPVPRPRWQPWWAGPGTCSSLCCSV